MSKLFQQPVKLKVREGNQHEPIVFLYNGRIEKVGHIIKRWRVSQGWWKRPVDREYFQIRTETGIVCELHRDLLAGVWYLQRIYD